MSAGDVFVQLGQAEAEAYLATQRDATIAHIAKARAQIAQYDEAMGSLKVTLYAKFGKSINLDMDPED